MFSSDPAGVSTPVFPHVIIASHVPKCVSVWKYCQAWSIHVWQIPSALVPMPFVAILGFQDLAMIYLFLPIQGNIEDFLIRVISL